MITIEVANSISKIEGLDRQQHKKLRHILSYKLRPEVIHFSQNYFNNRKYLLDKHGYFPTGLLNHVYTFIKRSKLSAKVVERRVVPAPQQNLFKLNLKHNPYKEQIEAADTCIEKRRGIVCAPTGVGKSLIIALIIDKLKVPTLVVTPSVELKRQISETLSECFGHDKVGHGKPILVENVQALDPTKKVTDYHAVIIDEFHHSAAATYQELNKKAWQNVYYRFGLTATPFRTSNNEEILLKAILSDVIYKIYYDQAVESNYIVPVDAYYIDVPITPGAGRIYNWAEAYSKLVTNNEPRNKIIAQLLNKLSDVSTLCLVKEIKHGENILTFIKNIPYAKGENDDNKTILKNFNSEKKKVLLGTTGIIGEGVDTKPAEFVVIAGLGKSKGQFMQQVGRVLRRYPGKETGKVIIFNDESHKWTKAHFKEQVKTLEEEYGVTPIRLDTSLFIS